MSSSASAATAPAKGDGSARKQFVWTNKSNLYSGKNIIYLCILFLLCVCCDQQVLSSRGVA